MKIVKLQYHDGKARYGKTIDELAAAVRKEFPAPARYRSGERYDPERSIPPLRRNAELKARYSLSDEDVNHLIAAVKEMDWVKWVENEMAKQQTKGTPTAYSEANAEEMDSIVERHARQLARGQYLSFDKIRSELDKENYRKRQPFHGPRPERVAALAERYRKAGVYRSYAECEAELS